HSICWLRRRPGLAERQRASLAAPPKSKLLRVAEGEFKTFEVIMEDLDIGFSSASRTRVGEDTSNASDCCNGAAVGEPVFTVRSLGQHEVVRRKMGRYINRGTWQRIGFSDLRICFG